MSVVLLRLYCGDSSSSSLSCEGFAPLFCCGASVWCYCCFHVVFGLWCRTFDGLRLLPHCWVACFSSGSVLFTFFRFPTLFSHFMLTFGYHPFFRIFLSDRVHARVYACVCIWTSCCIAFPGAVLLVSVLGIGLSCFRDYLLLPRFPLLCFLLFHSSFAASMLYCIRPFLVLFLLILVFCFLRCLLLFFPDPWIRCSCLMGYPCLCWVWLLLGFAFSCCCLVTI